MKTNKERYNSLSKEQRKALSIKNYNDYKIRTDKYYRSLGEEEYKKYLERCERKRNPKPLLHYHNKESRYYKYNNSYRNSYMKKYYGINLDQYKDLLIKQNNLCLICLKVLDNDRKTHIDHNHSTNKVRGILCSNCNMLLGHAKDNIIILKNAIKYLESK